ncbi:MAG: hypothetical protein EKK68_14310 [Candidatus Competibacteraceae bacterium]|nr:MAG: hypothetical protein EKK68_14310 [Candidatus Competibacteraceae bacterium]
MTSKPRKPRSSSRSSATPATRNAAVTLLQSLVRSNEQQLTVRINEQLLTLTQAMALAEQRLKAQ